MKTPMKKRLAVLTSSLAVVVIALGIAGGCRRNSGITDLVINPPKELGECKIIICALNTSTSDSLSGFTLNIKTPNDQITKTVTGNKFVLYDPVSGSYSVIASLNGFVTNTTNFNIILPKDERTGFVADQSIQLTKAAPAVSITADLGGTITVKTDSENNSSPAVATVSVPSGTQFTMADGTHPAFINMTVTNIQPSSELSPSEVVNGVKTLEMKGVDLAHQKVLVKNLDFQPEGVTFSKPLMIGINISDVFPSTMSQSEKTAHQNDLTIDNVSEDGSVESHSPDHFSSDRSIAYFKITHFSDWTLVFKSVTMTFEKYFYSPLQTKSGLCGEPLTGRFEYVAHYLSSDPGNVYLTWLITKQSGDVVYKVVENFNRRAVPGYSITATWQCLIAEWRLTDQKTGISRLVDIPVKGNKVTLSYHLCHNQGGGHN